MKAVEEYCCMVSITGSEVRVAILFWQYDVFALEYGGT
jgi:hypothetical protein